MKLLLASPTFHPHHGGAESLADDLTRLLVVRGHRVTVVTSTGATTQVPDWRHGARVLRLQVPNPSLSWLLHPGQARRYWHAARRYRLLLDQDGFDVACLARIDASARHLLRYRRHRRFRLCAYLHGGELRHLQKQSRRFRHILHWTLREADTIVAVSEALLEEAIRFEPSVADRIVLLPNGVDVPAIRQAPPTPVPARPYILFAGRLERVKNPLVLVESFARMASASPELDLVIAGTGSQMASLADRVARLGLVDRVRLLGDQSREQVFSLMKGARCLVVPSLAEAHPLVVLEAWVAGLPVLASAVKGLRDLVTDERGALFSLEDPDSLVRLLQRAAVDPSFLAAQRLRLAQLDTDSLDLSRLVERHLELLTGMPG